MYTECWVISHFLFYCTCGTPLHLSLPHNSFRNCSSANVSFRRRQQFHPFIQDSMKMGFLQTPYLAYYSASQGLQEEKFRVLEGNPKLGIMKKKRLEWKGVTPVGFAMRIRGFLVLYQGEKIKSQAVTGLLVIWSL